jgi:hypothetical protein
MPAQLEHMYFADFHPEKQKDFPDWQDHWQDNASRAESKAKKKSKSKSKPDNMPELLQTIRKNEYQYCEQYQIYKCVSTYANHNTPPQTKYFKFPGKPSPKVY